MKLFCTAIRYKRDGSGIQRGVGRDLGEAALLRLPFLIVRIGGHEASRHLRMNFADADDAGRVMKWKGREKKSVDDAEDRGGGPDAERERQHGRHGESGRAA